MKTYTQTSHNCFITALGCILEEDPEDLCTELGVTGLEICWPDRPAPYCYRGHHISEAIELCLYRNKALVPIYFHPALGEPGCFVEVCPQSRNILKERPALMEGRDLQHAYAWDGEKIWDPNGRWRELDDVAIRVAWALFDLMPGEIKSFQLLP